MADFYWPTSSFGDEEEDFPLLTMNNDFDALNQPLRNHNSESSSNTSSYPSSRSLSRERSPSPALDRTCITTATPSPLTSLPLQTNTINTNTLPLPQSSKTTSSSALPPTHSAPKATKSTKTSTKSTAKSRKRQKRDETPSSQTTTKSDSNSSNTSTSTSAKKSTTSGSGAATDDAKKANFKRQQRLMRNRASAQLSRERKKAHMAQMEEKIAQLEKENQALKRHVQSLTEENDALKRGGAGSVHMIGMGGPGDIGMSNVNGAVTNVSPPMSYSSLSTVPQAKVHPMSGLPPVMYANPNTPPNGHISPILPLHSSTAAPSVNNFNLHSNTNQYIRDFDLENDVSLPFDQLRPPLSSSSSTHSFPVAGINLAGNSNSNGINGNIPTSSFNLDVSGVMVGMGGHSPTSGSDGSATDLGEDSSPMLIGDFLAPDLNVLNHKKRKLFTSSSSSNDDDDEILASLPSLSPNQRKAQGFYLFAFVFAFMFLFNFTGLSVSFSGGSRGLSTLPHGLGNQYGDVNNHGGRTILSIPQQPYNNNNNNNNVNQVHPSFFDQIDSSPSPSSNSRSSRPSPNPLRTPATGPTGKARNDPSQALSISNQRDRRIGSLKQGSSGVGSESYHSGLEGMVGDEISEALDLHMAQLAKYRNINDVSVSKLDLVLLLYRKLLSMRTEDPNLMEPMLDNSSYFFVPNMFNLLEKSSNHTNGHPGDSEYERSVARPRSSVDSYDTASAKHAIGATSHRDSDQNQRDHDMHNSTSKDSGDENSNGRFNDLNYLLEGDLVYFWLPLQEMDWNDKSTNNFNFDQHENLYEIGCQVKQTRVMSLSSALDLQQ